MKSMILRIEKIKFTWGQKLSDITSQIDDIQVFENDNKYSVSQSLRVKVSSFLGNQINSVVFTSPFRDRVINSVQFNLPLFSNETDDIVLSLNKEFGKYNENGESYNHGFGSVPKYYRWKLSNCDLGISVYGGTRNEFGELNKGMIWFLLRDIELMSNLYSNELNSKNFSIDKAYIINKRLRTGVFQTQSHSLEKGNYPNYDQNFISVALNGFMKRNILLTPRKLSKELDSSEICIFEIKPSNRSFLANKFECIELNEIKHFKWIKSRPAKGPGNNWLKLDDFTVNDIYESNSIKEICEEIQSMINCKLEYLETDDC